MADYDDDEREPQREERRLERVREQEDRERARFEARKAAREADIQLENRIYNAAKEEATQAQISTLAIVATAYLCYRYSGWWAIAYLVAGGFWNWLRMRQEAKNPAFNRQRIDDLAEEAVIHERIAAADKVGRRWAWIEPAHKERYLGWTTMDGDEAVDFVDEDVPAEWKHQGILDEGYWAAVNKRAKDFAILTHAQREKALAEAKGASLDARLLIDLEARTSGTAIPWFARLDDVEIGQRRRALEVRKAREGK